MILIEITLASLLFFNILVATKKIEKIHTQKILSKTQHYKETKKWMK